MNYTKFAPIGNREGFGTLDTIFDEDKYISLKKAFKKNDFVVMDFVKDQNDQVYIESHHFSAPQNKIRHKLIQQNFMLGLSEEDFKICYDMASGLLLK